MKTTGLFATLILSLFVQINNGQQSTVINSQNGDTNNIISQRTPPHQLGNGNTGILPRTANQQQVQMQFNTPPPIPITQRVQPPDINEQTSQLERMLQQQQPLQLQQPAQLQQSLQADQPSQIQQTVHPQQPVQLQQPLSLQLNPTLRMQSFPHNLDFVQPATLQQQNNYQASVIPQSNLHSPNPQATVNVGQSFNMQNVNGQRQENSIGPHTEVVNSLQQVSDRPQEVSAIKYQMASQQNPSSFPLNTPVPSPSPSIALIPSYNIKPIDQTYASPYNYITPSPEVQPPIVERIQVTNPVQSLPSLLPIPSAPAQNVQTYYYNSQQAADPRQSVYVTQNSGFRYPVKTNIPVTVLQNQPTATLVSKQPSIVPSIPISIIQSPIQYGVVSSYPVNAIATTAYTSQRPKSSNLKSFLPLIFNLLKEKIASCGCGNGCSCKCKNQTDNSEPEVLSGYSSLKHYGALNDDALSVLNTVSEEHERTACQRERKNCAKKIIPEDSDESQEEDCDDDEVDDEEDE